MALVALTFALLSVGAAAAIAVRFGQRERRSTERLSAALERWSLTPEEERVLLRAELVREVEVARRGLRRTEAALIRVLVAAFGIGTVGAVSWFVGHGSVRHGSVGHGSVRHGSVGHGEAWPPAPEVVALGALGALGVTGAAVAVASLRARRASVAEQRRLLGRAGLLDRGHESR